MNLNIKYLISCFTDSKWSWLLLGLLILSACAPVPPATPRGAEGSGSLLVTMTGFRNDRGLARVLLFTSDEGFPDRTDQAWRNLEAEIRDGRADLAIHDVPWGSYALSVLHDEDGDNRMATNLLGFPEEGFGVSNGIKGRFGPPEFKKARIFLLIDQLAVPIQIEYLEALRNEHRREQRRPEAVPF